MNDDRQIAAKSQHNFHFLFHFESKTTGPLFFIFLHGVEALASLLMRAYTRRCCSLLWNARATNKGGQFRCVQNAPKINRLP